MVSPVAPTLNPADALNRRYLIDYPLEAAHVLEGLSPEETTTILSRQPINVILPIWEYFSTDISENILFQLPEEKQVELLTELDPSLCVRFLSRLDKRKIDTLLKPLNRQIAQELKSLLEYPPDSAGQLMDPRVLMLRPGTTVGQAQEKLRLHKPKALRELFVTDQKGVLLGRVALQDIAIEDADTPIATIQKPLLTSVQDIDPREEVIGKLEQYKADSVPVVDFAGHLVGVIRENKLFKALQEEMSVDIQTMVGVSKDERAMSTARFAVTKRLPWLHINLLTAFLASAVVGLFENTIAQFTALAVLLPVVAGQSGNAGAQALAVTMRGLSLREISVRHWPRVVIKEINAGLLNGIAIALTTSVCVYFWSRSVGLALVIAIAMVVSMMAAGFSGAVIPITLRRFGQDPAQSSSIILTTVTDIVGFFSFLGTATLLSALL